MLHFSTSSDAPVTPASTDALYWQAVLGNDRGFDGTFVYAVKTYGVYCRPSCPSRPPKRENTAFYASPAAAEAAGFRACKRCGGVPAPLTPVQERIGYALIETALGQCLIGIGPRAIMSIELGDDTTSLITTFKARFENAVELGATHGARTLVDKVAHVVSNPRVPHALSLDLQGTPFQKRVWQALRKVPAGQTVTYSELARAIGQPNSARAVGTACGANRLAVLIPCHRVVRADGGLSGFRWGEERKRKLLALEAGA